MKSLALALVLIPMDLAKGALALTPSLVYVSSMTYAMNTNERALRPIGSLNLVAIPCDTIERTRFESQCRQVYI